MLLLVDVVLMSGWQLAVLEVSDLVVEGRDERLDLLRQDGRRLVLLMAVEWAAQH